VPPHDRRDFTSEPIYPIGYRLIAKALRHNLINAAVQDSRHNQATRQNQGCFYCSGHQFEVFHIAFITSAASIPLNNPANIA
jgi:hypothetical protein